MRVPGATPLPADPIPEASQRAGMGLRNQARRLSDDCSKGWQPRPALHLYTRRGYDWSAKYPRIVESLLSLRVRSIIVDGEAVWAGKDGKSDFEKLHSNAHDDEVFLYGFDLLELNGEDYRQHPLERRKAKLEKILAWTPGMR
jgi:ATP dependent DNA ligase domain